MHVFLYLCIYCYRKIDKQNETTSTANRMKFPYTQIYEFCSKKNGPLFVKIQKEFDNFFLHVPQFCQHRSMYLICRFTVDVTNSQ